MLEKNFGEQRIIDCLKSAYGINVTTLTHLLLGADLDASVYKADVHNQSSFFVKQKGGYNLEIGTALQALLHDAGIQQVISPVKTIHGELTQYIDDFTLIVYPFIAGHDGFSGDLTKDQWITLGKTLRQVHEFHLPSSINEHIPREIYSARWQTAVRSMYSHMETEVTSDETGRKLLTFMKEQKVTIQHIVNRAEKLAQKLQKESPEFVLCHSDIHGGNVLIANNGDLYIVDWDQPIMAPKERDLMFIGGGVANVWNNPHEQDFFYTGYGETEISNIALAYYRYERIVEDIALYSQKLLLTTEGGTTRQEMYKHFIAMFEPNGVVDIACRTDNAL